MMQEPTSFNLGQEHMALHKSKKVMLSSLAMHFISKSSKAGPPEPGRQGRLRPPHHL